MYFCVWEYEKEIKTLKAENQQIRKDVKKQLEEILVQKAEGNLNDFIIKSKASFFFREIITMAYHLRDHL